MARWWHAGASTPRAGWPADREGVPILTLRQEKELPFADRHGAGLYHTAILFEDQRRLASALMSMAQRAGGLYEGSADHLVSQAFYFHDPEGNGIELYRDRPRDQWPTDAEGGIFMGSDPLDPNRFLREWYDPEIPPESGQAVIGHVHLQVGDVPRARAFYEGVLGLDVIVDLGTALFVSAGGYHHHLGMNTWRSAGAGPRAASLGLGDVRLHVPTRDDVEHLRERLRDHCHHTEDDGRVLRFKDPWDTLLTVTPGDV